ncbi:hypothetical protein QEV83_04860 [Methylocapsa sp. D3K7]|uniref:hypothetical protein n=1 Tax=Methylocapsa sp. D3K7 TaxID=3041435 RepID=UPI00244E9C8A|nr:hypothetical protein [Methylocapsa sp. D3K7]WGJ15603.1 hypothetical protein QEV83_04860 [Methylocapsa sp. D3K7]
METPQQGERRDDFEFPAMSAEPYDESEYCKEVYAHFGLAYYMAGVFESGLANAILQLDYLTQVAKDYRLKERENFDLAAYEAGFDAFLAKQYTLSLGNLVKRAQELAEMGTDLKAQIVEAKACRDFLAHHFFRERAVELCKRNGRDTMIAELVTARTIFDRVDQALTEFIEPYRKKLGISNELLTKHTARFLEEHGLPYDTLQN